MAAIDITEAEILEALRESMDNPDLGPADAFTRNEIAEAMGWSLDRTSAHLLAVKRQGQLEVVTVKREALDSRQMSVPGYRFLKKVHK